MSSKLKDFIKETKIDLTNTVLIPDGGVSENKSVYEISPREFLRFAKDDLKQETVHGLINSLTNSKRAIDCQIDVGFFKMGITFDKVDSGALKIIDYYKLNNDVPVKLKIISALNLAPNVLISKARNIRNRLEHLYEKPNREEVVEALEVAELFIRSVDEKFKITLRNFMFTDKANYDKIDFLESPSTGIRVSFNSDSPFFLLSKLINNKVIDSARITKDSEEYFGLLRLMFSFDDPFESLESFKLILKLIDHPIPSDRVSLYVPT